MKLSPSILSADFANLESEIKKIEKGGADYVHLDVMDGQFVPNITFGAPVIKELRRVTNLPFDLHLMIDSPERFTKDFVEAGVDIITVHVEATRHLHRTIQEIKSYGVKAGVSLNPATPVSVLEHVIDDLDLVLIMSVNPGFGGQSFIPATKDKIKEIKKISDERNLDLLIEVDGGVKLDNAKELMDLGANMLVVGSGIFAKDDVVEATKEFKAIE